MELGELSAFVVVHQDRICATCTATVHGPPGTECVDCHLRRQEVEWTALVRDLLAPARRDIPSVYQDVAFSAPWMARRFADKTGALALSLAKQLGNRTCVFTGPTRTGKTTLALAVFQHRLALASEIQFPRTVESSAAQEARLRRAGTARYARAYAVGSARDWAVEAQEYRAADVLVLDDLGVEPESMAPVLTEVLITRCDWRRQTLVASALDAEQLGRRYGEGVRARLFGSHEGIVLG